MMLGNGSRYSNRPQLKNSGFYLCLTDLGSFKEGVLNPTFLKALQLELCLKQLSLLQFVKQTRAWVGMGELVGRQEGRGLFLTADGFAFRGSRRPTAMLR